MKFYFVRHGQTDWNFAEKIQGGLSEIPLNETGVQQAYDLKNKLENISIDLAIISPMLRAKQTAEIIINKRNIQVKIDERLRERKLGEIEGKQITQKEENEMWDYKLNKEYIGGENIIQFDKRVIEFIEEIKKIYKDKVILIVAHGGVGKIFKKYLTGNSNIENLDKYSLKNCEIIEAEI